MTALLRHRELGPSSKPRRLETTTASALVSYYNSHANAIPVTLSSVAQLRGRQTLQGFATFYSYIICDQRRIVPMSCSRQSRSSTTRSALIKARVGSSTLYGEVLEIFRHTQGAHGSGVFAYMRWMEEFRSKSGANVPTTKDYWQDHRYTS